MNMQFLSIYPNLSMMIWALCVFAKCNKFYALLFIFLHNLLEFHACARRHIYHLAKLRQNHLFCCGCCCCFVGICCRWAREMEQFNYASICCASMCKFGCTCSLIWLDQLDTYCTHMHTQKQQNLNITNTKSSSRSNSNRSSSVNV